MNILENLKLLLAQCGTSTEQTIADILFKNSMSISVAESCTGGLVSSRLTDIAGSSEFIKENYVTYANEAKMKLLGVSEDTLEHHGAVSAECAQEMVSGLLTQSGCDIALITTGLAGPGGETEWKKVGLLYVAAKNKYATKIKKIEIKSHHKRKQMKFLFSQKALEFLIEFLNETELHDNTADSQIKLN